MSRTFRLRKRSKRYAFRLPPEVKVVEADMGLDKTEEQQYKQLLAQLVANNGVVDQLTCVADGNRHDYADAYYAVWTKRHVAGKPNTRVWPEEKVNGFYPTSCIEDRLNMVPVYGRLYRATAHHRYPYSHGQIGFTLRDMLGAPWGTVIGVAAVADPNNRYYSRKGGIKFQNRHRFGSMRGSSYETSFDAFEYAEKLERKRFGQHLHEFRITQCR